RRPGRGHRASSPAGARDAQSGADRADSHRQRARGADGPRMAARDRAASRERVRLGSHRAERGPQGIASGRVGGGRVPRDGAGARALPPVPRPQGGVTMGTAAAKPAPDAAVEIRVRFEPGLGSRLYASLKDGEVAPVTVARALGRGRTLLRYHGYTLM